MSVLKTVILRQLPHQSRDYGKQLIDESPDGTALVFKDAKRTEDQNSAQWPYLEGFAQQLKWPVNGEMVWLTKDEWKDILTSAFEEDVKPRIAVGFDGGMVMLGRRTRDYGKKKFSLWYEWLMAAAALKGIEPVYKNGRSDENYG